MRNKYGRFIDEIVQYIGGVVILSILLIFVYKMSELDPNNAALKPLIGSFTFIVRLFIDWGAPDPLLWIVRILIGAGIVIFKYGQTQDGRGTRF